MAQLFLSGTSWGTLTAGSVTDLTKHVALTAGTGFSITSGRLNIVIPSGGSLFANVSGTDVFRVSSAGVSVLSGTLAAPGATISGNLTVTGTVGGAGFAGMGTPAYYTYANAGNLRTADNATNDAIVESLGLFTWISGSTEPDDGETCFATASGAWILADADPDYVFESWVAELDAVQAQVAAAQALLATLQAQMAGLVLTGQFQMSLTALAAGVTTSFTVSVPGAVPGNSAIVTPGSGFSTVPVMAACISAPGVVTVYLFNPLGSDMILTPSTWSVMVIT